MFRMTEDSFDQRTAESLAELRAAMSSMEAPAEVKWAVLSEYHSTVQRRRKLRVALASWGAIAACLVLMAAGLYWRLTENERISKPQETVVKPPPPPSVPDTLKEVATVPRQAVKRPVRRVRRRPSEAIEPVRTAVDFVALPAAPPIDAAEGGSILRVDLPRSAMRSFGIAVDEIDSPGRVMADVMVGSDGVARAVRFVSLRSSR
jgi:hypothetical protein